MCHARLIGLVNRLVPDWLDLANAWAAIPLAVIGFLVAIIQATRAQSAAAAAKKAAETASSKINSNLLLSVLPQLAQVETNLEWAIVWAADTGNHQAVIHYLGAWRWQASQIRGHLDANDDQNEEILTALQTSITIAADTKIALQESGADVVKRTRSALKAIASVTGLLGEMTTKNALERTESHGH